MKRTRSLQTTLPLYGSALLLLIIAALATSAYVVVRKTTIVASETRLKAVTQQLAASLRTNAASSLAALRANAENPVLRAYLRAPGSMNEAEIVPALQPRGPGTAQMLAVTLQNRRGERVAAWGPGAARTLDADVTDLVQIMVRGDSGGIGKLRALGDSVVYPVFVRVMDGEDNLGYLVQWRRQFSTQQGRRVVTELIGDGAELYIGDTSQGFWTDLARPVAGPPILLPLGSDLTRPQIVRYERAGVGERYAGAARVRGTPWVALVEFPAAAVLSPASVFARRLVAASAVIAVIAVVAMWLLSLSLTKPLNELVLTADAVSSGARHRRVRIKRDDELGALATAINRLTKGVDESRRADEERFGLLVASVKDYAIFLLDPAGNVVTWNSGAERLKGYQASEIIGRHFSRFYPPEDVDAGKPAAELRIAAAEGHVEDEGWRVRADGSMFWANVVITALRNDGGRLVGFGKVTRDMTDRRAGEEALRARTQQLDLALTQLQDAQEMLVRREKLAILGQLSSGVGHELRNPLGVMSNAIYYLETVQPNASADVKEYLGILRRQVALATKIVSDLLDFARVKPPEREAVTLPDIVQEQVGRLGHLDRVRVHIEIPRTLPAALADHVQVGQVIFNLLTNAVQAMEPNGGTIIVRADVEDARVRLRIIDEGQGVPVQNLEKIFEPLFTTKARGMGLGLAVSRALAIANGGDITVDSREGHGATFTFTLPTVDLGKAA